MKIRQELLRMSADEYHADPVPPSLSSSIAHELIRHSPKHAHLRHPHLGGQRREKTRSMDRGELSHRLLLGAGSDVALIEANDYRTRKARDAQVVAIAAGQIPVLASEYEKAKQTADILLAEFNRYDITLDGESEMVALWGEQTFEGEMVQCRGMLDHITRTTIYDLKSCRSAHPDACQRHIDEYGYAIQRAAYVSALEKIRPTSAGRLDFVFVFYELEPPYAVTPIRLSGEFRELGRRQWRRAFETWAKCLRSDSWPTYTDSIIEIEPKPWALTRDMDEQVAAASATWSKGKRS